MNDVNYKNIINEQGQKEQNNNSSPQTSYSTNVSGQEEFNSNTNSANEPGISYIVSNKYNSYDQVPIYRKLWFAVTLLIVFSPLLLVVLMTGTVYRLSKKDNLVLEASPYQKKTFYGLILLIFIMGISRAI